MPSRVRDLTKEHTKVLLKWLRRAYKCHGPACPEDYGYDPSENGGDEVSIKELKAELAKREHVPNKIEAKKLRQDKAKAKRNR